MTSQPPPPAPEPAFAVRFSTRAIAAMRATGRYLRHKAADFAAVARDIREHPGSFPQDLAALVVSLGTSGGNRQTGPGTFVLYENARGLGAWIPGRAKHTAITIGNIAFSRKSCARYSTLYWHEQTHHLQSGEEGWKWAIRYVRESRKRGYRANKYEVEAYERGPRGAGRETCEWRQPGPLGASAPDSNNPPAPPPPPG